MRSVVVVLPYLVREHAHSMPEARSTYGIDVRDNANVPGAWKGGVCRVLVTLRIVTGRGGESTRSACRNRSSETAGTRMRDMPSTRPPQHHHPHSQSVRGRMMMKSR